MKETKNQIKVGAKSFDYYSLKAAKAHGLDSIDKLPRSLKVLLENILRKGNDPEASVSWKDAQALNTWVTDKTSSHEISFYPARVLMQDFTGVPAVVDLAAMRDAIEVLGGDAKKINPSIPVDLVIDHSIQVEHFGSKDSFEKNVDIEYQRNLERYNSLKWAQKAFTNFRVVPPNTGIVHQVNLEYFAKVAWLDKKTNTVYPDTCVGTDSHTTMINGLSVLAWGVGGIEAEAAMLGQPISMIIPEVIGFKLDGKLQEGVTATDLVLNVTKRLREYGVVGKFVEFYGNGVKELSLTDRATLGNMSPEYGGTCAFFPVDEKTIDYLKLTGRDEETIKLTESYAKEQGLWAYKDEPEAIYTDVIELDLSQVKPSIAGPKRPQDKIDLDNADIMFNKALDETFKVSSEELKKDHTVENKDYKLTHGDLVIAAITSCTNTSNPSVMIAAGLVAQKAAQKGLKVKPWVKTSLAPGSQVVTDYLTNSGLQAPLDELGFNLVGYGCTTCIGNSGPLDPSISKTINDNNLVATSVLSGNRNFEGRISPDVKANYLASPPLVVAYALAGSLKINIAKDSLGKDKEGNDVYLKDIWPSSEEIEKIVTKEVSSDMFNKRYAEVFTGDERWAKVDAPEGEKYAWNPKSTYIKSPPFFDDIKTSAQDSFKITDANILALLGDSTTTDHISPAGSFSPKSPAGKYLVDHDVKRHDFNSYGSRRGNFEVMTRGTFANIRIKNEMVPGVEGGYTKYIPNDEQMTIYDASMEYQKNNTPLVVIAGKEYGSGSSRDWAAKGTKLLGIQAVVAESFERIHRSNLIGMKVMPLEFTGGVTRKSLKLDGSETITINPNEGLQRKATYKMTIKRSDNSTEEVELLSRIDTQDELGYFKDGGILEYVLRRLAK